MAYLRGKTYIWADDGGLHLWQALPPNTEFMEMSGWAETNHDEPRASVYLPNRVFDDLVLRRYDEMTEHERTRVRRRIAREEGGDGD